MAPLHSFKLMGPKFWLRNFRCHASWKRMHGALNLHCSSYISKIVRWLPMFDFGIFCTHGDISGGAPVRVFEKFHSLFSFSCLFLFFFSILHFPFPPLLGAPLAPGPLERGPWTLSTHATQLLRHRDERNQHQYYKVKTQELSAGQKDAMKIK